LPRPTENASGEGGYTVAGVNHASESVTRQSRERERKSRERLHPETWRLHIEVREVQMEGLERLRQGKIHSTWRKCDQKQGKKSGELKRRTEPQENRRKVDVKAHSKSQQPSKSQRRRKVAIRQHKKSSSRGGRKEQQMGKGR